MHPSTNRVPRYRRLHKLTTQTQTRPKLTTTDDGRVLSFSKACHLFCNLCMSSNPIRTPTCTTLTPQIFGPSSYNPRGGHLLCCFTLSRRDRIRSFTSASIPPQSSDPFTLTHLCLHLDHHFPHSKPTALLFISFATLSTSLHPKTLPILLS
jgi:hypothetical protein